MMVEIESMKNELQEAVSCQQTFPAPLPGP